MPMNFEEAEARFRELQARVQRGEAVSRAEYEEQVSQLAVQDRNGVLWEINPRTGKWMYFDGAEWVSGTPPGHETSSVIPVPGRVSAGPDVGAPAPFTALSAPPPPPPARTSAPPPTRPAAPAVPLRPVSPPSVSAPPSIKTAPESLKPYVRPQERPAVPPPGPVGGPTPSSQPSALSPLTMFGPNREWIPLAIGAVVLLLCAIFLFVGGNFALGALGSKPTPTRTLAPTLPATAVPTVVRLPTVPPPTATPQPVLAKVIERAVNVRNGPSTKNKIISSLKKDNQVTLIGRNDDSTWYQVNIVGAAAPGWVFGETLEIVSGDPTTLPVVGPTPTPTKGSAPPPAVQPTPTLVPLGTLPTPTPTPKP